MDLQRLKEEQELILNQVDNGIALFDPSHHLVLFNQKLAQTWGLSTQWLAAKPHYDQVVDEVVEHGYWSEEQSKQIRQALRQQDSESVSFYVEQTDGVCLEVYMTATSNGSHLLTLRDVTSHQHSQLNLNAEVRRLRFLLGLNERLHQSDSLREVGQYALNYLVEVMNAAFGDVKVISGEGASRHAGPLTNEVSSQFIATYGEPAVAEMQALLERGIPYGEGLLWGVVETREPLFVEDYANHPNAVSGFRHPAIGQLGIFPIPATNGNIIGVLTLESRNLRKLQEAPQRDMLLAACRTLGVAIERAQSQERLRQINENLERASQLKSEFLASMSHELRTPLNSILGFSDLLLRQTGGTLTERQTNHVKLIEKSGQHLLQLINDILDLSKIEAGKVELSLEPVSIQDLCTECLKMIQPRADKKCLALSLELDYRVSQVPLDERRVRQIIINLLSNAVKFTPEGGAVKLSGRLAYGQDIVEDYRPDCSPVNPSTPYLCLEIKDSGIGIPSEKWHLLFRPFQQVDCSLSRRHEGTGLGLVLTRRLAELHGGTVSLKSTVNQGSIFRVWLPLTEMRHQFSPKEKPSTPASPEFCELYSSVSVEQAKILVVEDQPFNQLLISEALELENYAVELISDGQAMWQRIHTQGITAGSLPSLILMDIQLPDVDGFELMRQLKLHPLWKSIPIIAVTAMAMAGDREQCLNAGADAYLSKPLDLTKLLITVQSLII